MKYIQLGLNLLNLNTKLSKEKTMNSIRYPHHQYFSGVALKIMLLFVVVGIAFLLLNQSTYTTEFFQSTYSFSEPKQSSTESLHSSSSSDNHAAIQQNVLSKFHQFMTDNLPSQVGYTMIKEIIYYIFVCISTYIIH